MRLIIEEIGVFVLGGVLFLMWILFLAAILDFIINQIMRRLK